jgi:four helix bundle protein
MRDFRELKVWVKAHQLALAIYQATKAFPREEMYGLTSQMRRSSSSIPFNIVEGCGRGGTEAELARFMRIAMGSAAELEYQLLLARDLAMLSPRDYERLHTDVVEVRRMLNSFIQKLTANS